MTYESIAEAQIERLHDEVEALRAALKDIRAKARFEQDNPTGLHMTCLSLIEKAAAVAEMKLIRPEKVKPRSDIKNPLAGTWTKRDDKSGKFMDVKAEKPFKGVRKVIGRP